MTSVAIFVDTQNVYYTVREAYGKHFDYRRFWARATANREVLAARCYATDKGDAKQREFQNILRSIGFEVRLKPFIQRADGSAKGDWDVGITLDAIEYAVQADVVVLVSGDGDFDLLAEKIREVHGKRVEVYGVPKLTANSLINAASQFIPIEGELLLG
ncbi:NYN domain-containing protein [Chromohalobacter sp. 11-W]|uniref:LabA-like NYN domain-containing protein n=1 Tax=Chromohalobacter sp. 11-W TaxID=2994061 RepID=UPI0024682FBA|nr:NYN domain-containing protein [Chromohalobacter sp. 11-W]